MATNLAKKKNLSSADLKQRERLAFLEALLVWRGRISRADLASRFAVSLSQAAEDFNALRKIHGGSLIRANYLGQQCVMATEKFSAVLIDAGALGQAGLLAGENWLATAPQPPRRGTPVIEITLARAAVNGLEVDMLYHSVTSGRSTWRKVTPVRFVNDGSRWHVRGFCDTDKRFKDYVLGRIEKVRLAGPAKATAKQDKDWAKFITLVIRPRRGLNGPQVRALVRDYGMEKGSLAIRVRLPLAYHVLHHHGLLPGEQNPQLELVSPREGTADHSKMIRRES